MSKRLKPCIETNFLWASDPDSTTSDIFTKIWMICSQFSGSMILIMTALSQMGSSFRWSHFQKIEIEEKFSIQNFFWPARREEIFAPGAEDDGGEQLEREPAAADRGQDHPSLWQGDGYLNLNMDKLGRCDIYLQSGTINDPLTHSLTDRGRCYCI